MVDLDYWCVFWFVCLGIVDFLYGGMWFGSGLVGILYEGFVR